MGEMRTPSELAMVQDRICVVPPAPPQPVSYASPAEVAESTAAFMLAADIRSADTGAVKRRVHAYQHGSAGPMDPWRVLTEVADLLIRRAEQARVVAEPATPAAVVPAPAPA